MSISGITSVPIDDLHLESNLDDIRFSNPRTESGLDDASIRELADDITRRGLLYPLLVWEIDDDCYIVLSGQRRLRALQHNSAGYVPVRIVRAASIDEARATALADNLHRSQLSSYETAQALAGMVGSVSEIAERVGLTPAYVGRLLNAWHGAGDELREAWRTKAVSIDDVYTFARLAKSEQKTRLVGGATSLAGLAPPPPRPNKKRPGARRGYRNRPTIAMLRKLEASMKREGPPRNDYERGLLEMLGYVLHGVPVTGAEYSPDHGRQRDREDHRDHAHDPDSGPGSVPPVGRP